MNELIKVLQLIEKVGATDLIATILVIGAVAFITIFCWATVRYVPTFVKQTTRIADNLEKINIHNGNLDDKVDHANFVIEEVKKRTEDIYTLLVKQTA